MILLVLPDLAEEDILLARANRGDQKAVIEIYDRYFEPIYQFIRMRTGDDHQAEDLASDVFLKLLSALQNNSAPRQSLRGWLFRVARNVLHDHFGDERRLNITSLEEWMPDTSGLTPETHAISRSEAAAVRSAMQQLPEDQQEVLVLRFGQMLSLQDTADIMGRSVSAIKSLQFRATDNLRKLIVPADSGGFV